MFYFGVASTLVAVAAIWYAYSQRAKVKTYVAAEAAKAADAVKAKL